MTSILRRIEWAIAQVIYFIGNAGREPRTYGMTVVKFRAEYPFWTEDGNTRTLHLSDGSGLVFERKDD